MATINKGYLLNKEEFVKIISEFQKQQEFLHSIYVASDGLVDLYEIVGPYETIARELLVRMYSDEEAEWISYFMYELDFGKRYHAGSIQDEFGNPIPLATAEDLWEFLMYNLD